MTAAEVLSRLNIDEETLAAFCHRWSVVQLAVFGSVARGEMRPDSDVDVMVEFATGADLGPWLSRFEQMRDELQGILGRKVEVMEMGAIANPYRRRSIMRDLTVLYAA